MNTKLIAIAATAIILLGAGGLLLYNKSNKPSSQTTYPSATPTPPQETSMKNSLLGLLGSGKTQMCSFSYNAKTGGSTKGTVFLTGTKMRGDFDITTSSNKSSKIMMIRDGDTTYLWGTDLKTGIKMTLKKEDLKTNAQANQYFDTKQKLDYKCGPWVVDSSVFTPPTNVKFTDFSAMMEGSIKTTATPGGDVKMDASACASITDPGTRAACEKAASGQ